ncbi:MAG: metallophosphoesterase [Candidatus Acidiferrales bacterium]|jgi:predicted MPP superfamily phosphohydrolase
MRQFLIVFMAVAGLALAIDAYFVEPNRIEVTHSWVEAPLDRPLKIAHLTDLHTSGLGRPERKLLNLLDVEQPDAIVITGDSLGWGHNAYDRIRPLLSRLHAPLGVWLVRGNWENSYPLRDNYPVHDEHAFYSQLGIHFLLNQAEPIRPDIWLVGLDDPSNGTPDLDAAMRTVPKGVYAIAAFHAPGFFDEIAGRVPLVLTGHTHGGQVRLPFVPVFWLPRGSGRFLEGWYGEQGSKMNVSRGIGMSGLPIRFRCRPELSMITVGR